MNIFVIESNHKFEEPIKMNDNLFIYPLNFIDIEKEVFYLYYSDYLHLELESNRITSLKPLMRKLKENENQRTMSWFYILSLNIVEMTKPSKDINENINGNHILSLSPRHICLDLCNILSWYYQKWFRLISEMYPLPSNHELTLLKPEFDPSKIIKYQEKFDTSFTRICELRKDQFYLLLKSFTKLNQSLIIVEKDVDLGLILLTSAIENLARKYGENENFNSKINFYQKLRRIIFRTKKGLIHKDQHEDLFNEIGEGYIQTAYSKIQGKFNTFCLTFFPVEFLNEKAEELLEDIYYIRSKFLHAGEQFLIPKRNEIFTFNQYQKSGEISKDSNGDNDYVRVARIPAYDNLAYLFWNIVTNFVNFLHAVRCDTEDKDRYHSGDIVPRGQISVTPNRPIEPFRVIYNKDYYKSVDYIDLEITRLRITKIKKFQDTNNFDEALIEIDKIVSHPNFSFDYYQFRNVIYTKISVLFKQRKYDDCTRLFDDFGISEVNTETLGVFNLKGYIFAYQGKYEESHSIIDEVLTKVESRFDKANFLDSKGDFYKLANDFNKAIHFYKSSLNITNDPPFSFHKETQHKLNECLNSVKY